MNQHTSRQQSMNVIRGNDNNQKFSIENDSQYEDIVNFELDKEGNIVKGAWTYPIRSEHHNNPAFKA